MKTENKMLDGKNKINKFTEKTQLAQAVALAVALAVFISHTGIIAQINLQPKCT